MIKLTSLIATPAIGGVVNSRKTVKESEEFCPKCGKATCECGMGEDTLPTDEPTKISYKKSSSRSFLILNKSGYTRGTSQMLRFRLKVNSKSFCHPFSFSPTLHFLTRLIVEIRLANLISTINRVKK